MVWTTDIADCQTIRHFQFQPFWKEEWVLHPFHWKDNPMCSALLFFLEICRHKTLCFGSNISWNNKQAHGLVHGTSVHLNKLKCDWENKILRKSVQRKLSFQGCSTFWHCDVTLSCLKVHTWESHFLFYHVQCTWIYGEVLDPLGFEFLASW